jgi:DNA-binding transcriptional MerR regulator
VHPIRDSAGRRLFTEEQVEELVETRKARKQEKEIKR